MLKAVDISVEAPIKNPFYLTSSLSLLIPPHVLLL